MKVLPDSDYFSVIGGELPSAGRRIKKIMNGEQARESSAIPGVWPYAVATTTVITTAPAAPRIVQLQLWVRRGFCGGGGEYGGCMASALSCERPGGFVTRAWALDTRS